MFALILHDGNGGTLKGGCTKFKGNVKHDRHNFCFDHLILSSTNCSTECKEDFK